LLVIDITIIPPLPPYSKEARAGLFTTSGVVEAAGLDPKTSVENKELSDSITAYIA
jgi:hypothetical protein